jgi:hypothetical protein
VNSGARGRGACRWGARGRGACGRSSRHRDSPLPKGVVAWQLFKVPVNLLVDCGRDIARSAGIVESPHQAGALVHSTVTSITVVDNLL